MTTAFRIALLISGVFLCGVGAGHLITRRWNEPVSVSEDTLFNPESTSSDPAPNRRQIIRATRRVMEQYRETLGLSDEQVAKMQPAFVRAGQEMSQLAKTSPLRFGIIARVHSEIRPLLDERQRQLCDAILKRSREKHGQLPE